MSGSRWYGRIVAVAGALTIAVAAIMVPPASAQEEEQPAISWPDLDTVINNLSNQLGRPEDKAAPSAQNAATAYRGDMILQVQAQDFYGRPLGPSKHTIPGLVTIGGPTGDARSSGRETNPFRISAGAQQPGQSTPYDLWIRSADLFATSSGSLMLQYWEYQAAETRDGMKIYRGKLVRQHNAEAAVWNLLMVPTQIYPNGPGMQFPHPIDVGAEIAIGLANRAVAVAVGGTASHGQYPFLMEIYARQSN